MDLIITTQNRYDRAPDGRCWTTTGMAYGYWTRYLDVFDRVLVAARLRDVAKPPHGAARADGEGVEIRGLPYFVGPWEMLARSEELRRVHARLVPRKTPVILRVPAQPASCLRRHLAGRGIPWAVEVIADPWEQFGPGVHATPVMPLLRLIARIETRLDCCGAAAAAYVTEGALQRRYPCPNGMFGVSDVDLDDEAFAGAPRRFPPGSVARSWILAGSLHHGQKGVDIILKSISILAKHGLCPDARLTVIGDGFERPGLMRLAERLGVAGRIEFAGALPTPREVRARFDEADLFVLPSRSEGLPRAMLEAMARGLPCIGTRVGGVPEILPDAAIVPPGDPAALARLLHDLSTDPARLGRLAADLFTTAGRFRKTLLRPKLRGFLERVRSACG
ncbi:MAG TPA: glycosyltransferase [Candidatus Ozemobacteraceae bacterium]|nr:glycosyltransferase [Candidatus Ozemobacteraceae bacterium]